MQIGIDSVLFQFETEETILGLLFGLATVVPALMGAGRRALYGAVTVILAAATVVIYFRTQQELIAALAGPIGELPVAGHAIAMMLKGLRLFGLTTLGALLATILFSKKVKTS